MSHPQIDLTKESVKASSKDVYKTLVAVFKEEPENARVLADSEAYLAYTLKNGRTLRLIQRSNNMKGSLRVHTKPVHAVQFVNYRSNVAASAAENEFLVWVVTNENPAEADPVSSTLTVKLYFKLQDTVTIGSFAFFMNAQVGIFDILVLYDKKAAVLESSKLIQAYKSEPLEAALASDSRELRELTEKATTRSLCAINNGGWFAFTMEPTMVAACTMRNRSTPAWSCCEGAPIINLELLDLVNPEDPTMLVACSSVKAYQWELTGSSEPQLLRTLWFGGSIVTMLSSRSTLALFNDKRQVALVDAHRRDAVRSTVYELGTLVRPRSVCFNRKTSYGCVLVDAQTQVEMYQLTSLRDKDGNVVGTASGAAAATGAGAGAAAAAGGTTPTAAAATDSKGSPTTTDAPAAPKSYAAALSSGLAAKSAAAAAAAAPISDPAILSVSREVPPPPSASAPATAAAATKSNATANHVKNLMAQVQRGNIGGVAVATTTTSAAANENAAAALALAEANTHASPSSNSNSNNASAAAAAAARALLLQNTALPQGTDGPLASATHASDEAVRRELESLQTMSKNISQILQLTPDQIARDHEQLVSLALEAQMTELQNSGAHAAPSAAGATTATATAAAADGARDVNAEAFNSYAIVKLMAPIANDIAKGVTLGIRNTLRTELDNAIRDAFGSQIRDAQRRALKKRLDDALVESTAHFSNEVRQRLGDFATRDLQDVFLQVNSALNGLVEENRRLQTCLNDMMRCGALEQLRETQRELQQLRDEVRAGSVSGGAGGGVDGALGANPSSFQGARPTPETMLTTARHLLLDEHRAREALEYITMARQPSLTLRLVKEAAAAAGGSNGSGALVNDESVPDDLWIEVLAQLSQPSALDGSQGSPAEEQHDAMMVAELLLDVLCERDALTSMKTAKAKGLLSDIRHFILRQKQALGATTEGQRVLRDLEKSIQ